MSSMKPIRENNYNVSIGVCNRFTMDWCNLVRNYHGCNSVPEDMWKSYSKYLKQEFTDLSVCDDYCMFLTLQSASQLSKWIRCVIQYQPVVMAV